VRLRFDLVLAAVVALAPLAGAAQPEAPPAAGEAPSRQEIRKALEKVADDPNLATGRTVSMLRLKRSDPITDEPSWWRWANAAARWFGGLFAFIAESGRLLVWVLGALGAGLLVYYVLRLVRTRGLPRVPRLSAAPSHVRDLDIRPESLPDDVGAAALALWQRGEQRAALALLYRGLLSRLVHVHAVPIRASSERSARYTAQLVEVWAAAVYGAREPAAGTVQALCADFAPALDATGAP
jgi:hypothetical protein